MRMNSLFISTVIGFVTCMQDDVLFLNISRWIISLTVLDRCTFQKALVVMRLRLTNPWQ